MNYELDVPAALTATPVGWDAFGARLAARHSTARSLQHAVTMAEQIMEFPYTSQHLKKNAGINAINQRA